MSRLMSRLAALPPERRARLLAGDADPGPVAASRPDGTAPASFVQEQLWALHRITGGAPVYNVPFSVRLRGPLEVPALLAAVGDLFARHRVLSARLRLTAAGLTQVAGPARVEVPVEPAPPGSPATREAWARRRAVRLARTRFDLAAGPLNRLALLRLGGTDHLLVWVGHHAVLDGWSVGLLCDELGERYRARTAGSPADPPAGEPAPRPRYADYADWQRARLRGPRLDRLVETWRAALAGAVPAAAPADLPRPSTPAYRGAGVEFALPDRVLAAAGTLARRCGATPTAVLVAAWAVLLTRRAGAPDAVIGMPFTGRTRPELEPMIGPLSNALPVRVPLGDTPAGAEAVRRTQAALDHAAAHQDVPFGALVKALAPDRAAGTTPLFQVVFNTATLPRGTGRVPFAPGLAARPGGHPNGTARMDLELALESGPGGTRARLDYDVALFTPAAAERLAGEYVEELDRLAGDPDRRVGPATGPGTGPGGGPYGGPGGGHGGVGGGGPRAEMIAAWLDR